MTTQTMTTHRLTTLILALLTAVTAIAANYREYLTAERGYTEVTTADELTAGPDYYFILTSAEDDGLIVGLGAYEAKPSWASEESKALRYITADSDPMLELSNYFTIEKSGTSIGLRNVVYSADMMQTHDAAGFMYVNTFTDKNLDEWSQLTPTYTDGHWLLESSKYPIAGGDAFSGFLGPWNNAVRAGEPLALNRKNTPGDEAGQFRIYRISKSDFDAQFHTLKRQQLATASSTHPIDATWLITNPSFETGDATGWTRTPNVTDDNEFNTRDYPLSDKEGGYLFNAYQWWASSLSVSQTVENVPAGRYELSAAVATWESREVTFAANMQKVTTTGINDATAIPVVIPLTTHGGPLTISTTSTAQWWVEGHESEIQTFFKLDNVRLTCLALFLDGMALPLPNDDTTRLLPGQWYYYEATYPTPYRLKGNLGDMVYATDGDATTDEISTQPAERQLTLPAGRTYFMTPRSNATLSISALRTIDEETLTVAALNVDGLPQTVAGFKINEDGPGSDGTKLISKYLAQKGYDLIGVSEDFNYHGSLMSALDGYDSGTVRATLSISDLGIPFDTDGLNLIWKSGLVDKDTESWTRWTSTTKTDGNQYVKKGFRHYVTTVGTNMAIDIYVLHMDAGDATASREAQWEQLAQAINSGDSSLPKIILGDTNSRWTREDIRAHFFDLITDYDVADAWAELCCHGNYPTTDMADFTDSSDPTAYDRYEVVDKVIYLNPKAADTTQLRAKSFKIERDYTYGEVDGTDSAKPLGDHRPVVVEFACCHSGELISITGDVNRDGNITVADVMGTVGIILGKDNTPPYIYDHQAADANGNKSITVADVMAIVNIVLGNK